MRAPAGAPPGLPVVFTRPEALRAGLSRSQVLGRVRSGTWHRLAAVYCPAQEWEAADSLGRVRLVAAATQRRWPGAVLSHTSAAAMWSLPLPLLPLPAAGSRGTLHPTWLTAPPGSGTSGRRGPHLVIEVAALPESQVVRSSATRYGSRLQVTAVARTAADCLRHLSAFDAVAVADAAGARGLSRARLTTAVAQQAGWPGADTARRALGLVDPRRESWLESASWVVLAGRGVPVPEPQVEVRTPGGRFVARVDGYWADHGVVGEADGWSKYRAAGLASVAGAERALRAEKQREDALRDLGLEVVRWGTDGVVRAQGVTETVERLQRAFRRGDSSRVTAVLRSTPLPASW